MTSRSSETIASARPSWSRAGLCRALGAALALATTAVTGGEAAAEVRSLSFYNTHTYERATVTFKRNGTYDQAGLQELNRILRDWRRNESTRMDPQLFDLVWEVYRDSGSREPIHIVSAYRSPVTNNMLRSRSRGVAKVSQHMLGKAMDFFLPDVPLSRLREIGMKKQFGGVGFYPTSGSPFVHMDTGNVRAWPRMTRDQLARLFPDGKTAHLPAEGGALPGYEQALAEVARRKGRPVGSMVASAPTGAGGGDGGDVIRPGGGGGNLIASLFGGGGGEDDEEAPSPAPRRQAELRATPGTTPAPAARAAADDEEAAPARPAEPTRIAALPPAAPSTRPAQAAADPKALLPSTDPARTAVDLPLPTPAPKRPAGIAVAALPTPIDRPQRDPNALPPGWAVGPGTVAAADPASPAAPAAAVAATTGTPAPGVPVPAPRPGFGLASGPQPQPAQPTIATAALGFAAPPGASTALPPALTAPATTGADLRPAVGVPLPLAKPTARADVAALGTAPVAAPRPAAPPPPVTASLPVERGERTARGGDPLSRMTSHVSAAPPPALMDGATTTRRDGFAAMAAPRFEVVGALMRKPTATVAQGFGASADQTLRVDRFSGTAIAVLQVMRTE